MTTKDITVIIPVHEAGLLSLAAAAVDSVVAQTSRPGAVLFVTPSADLAGQALDMFAGKIAEAGVVPLTALNDGPSDFCSQINKGAADCQTEWFSILEADDRYLGKWLETAARYQAFHEDADVLLPIAFIETGGKCVSMANQPLWAKEFSERLGYMDVESLMAYFDYSVTGGVFKTRTFLETGGLKPSMTVSFWYEFLLRLCSSGHQCFVVPRVGYAHELGREGSLFKHYQETIPAEEAEGWLRLAQEEYVFKQDRGKTPAKKQAILPSNIS